VKWILNASEREFIIGVFRDFFRKTLCSSLGESAGKAVLLLMQKRLGRDFFEVFWEDPKAAYCEMERIFGVGANVLISLLAAGIEREYNLKMSPEHLLNLMRSGDHRSREEMRSFLRKMAESHLKKRVLPKTVSSLEALMKKNWE